MKDSLCTTTPFEDLILGSQFIPVLVHTNTVQEENIGIFQCKKCCATFLLEQEALCHYKFHVLESHKDYFSVVVGDLCPQKDCSIIEKRGSGAVHFHCSYCSFATSEILELPLHMEEDHLSFYKEVSLILKGEDVQVNKIYECGECCSTIQGTVSIVHHLMTHESDHTMDLAARFNGLYGLMEDGIVASGSLWENYSGISQNGDKDPENKVIPLSDFVLKCLREKQEHIQVEINPLELLSSLIEEDQKSENPLLPTQHFLLGHSDNLPCVEGGASPSCNPVILDEDNMQLPQPMILSGLNGCSDTFYEQSAGVFQCKQCNEAFKYQYLLVAHRKQVHQGNVLTPFKCHVCSNEFALLSDLKRHMATHSTDFTHFCQVCGYAFKDEPSLKNHMVDHGQSPGKLNLHREPQSNQLHILSQSAILEKNMKCDGCNMEFPSKAELTRHIVEYQGTCNPNKAEILKCATCGDDLPNLEALKEHRRNRHPLPEEILMRVAKKGFQCDYCGKNFSCRSNLRDHLVVHTGEKPYPCDICSKSFSFIHNMKTHRLTHNTGRNEVCPYCDKAYKSKISLYYHMKKGNCRGLSTKEVPEGFRRCTECLQMFASEERYQNHKAKGSCHMSYRCTNCGIRCASQDRLNKHIQKGICKKAQSEQKQLRRRRRRHLKKGEEPLCCQRCNNFNRDCCCTFSCQGCGKRVFSRSAFMAHQRLHASSNVRHKKDLIKNETSGDSEREKNETKTKDREVDEESSGSNSGSGSLTDLSTFTAPNLLEPVPTPHLTTTKPQEA